MQNFREFLQWEQSSRDTVDVKCIYVDMAGDIKAGLLLSQIVYWYLPGKSGNTKLRIEKYDKEAGCAKEWIAKARHEWWDEIRLSPRQVDNAIKKLKEKGLVETKVHRFHNMPTTHIRLLIDTFIALLEHHAQNPMKNPFSPNGENKAEKDKKLLSFSPNGENKNHQTVSSGSPNGENINKDYSKTTTKKGASPQEITLLRPSAGAPDGAAEDGLVAIRCPRCERSAVMDAVTHSERCQHCGFRYQQTATVYFTDAQA